MLRRRTLNLENKYIMDGLVLWLDGLNKGNVPGSWVDRIAGHIFEGVNEPVFGSNYVQVSLTDDSYFQNTTFSCPSALIGTIEIIATDHVYNGSQIIFITKSLGLAFGFYNNEDVIASTGTRTPIVKAPVFSVVSVNQNNAVVDGRQATRGATNNWGSTSTSPNYIGKRYNGLNYTGKIHSLRIYNRLLTTDEMLHNQRIDNKRYNLGLTI